VIGKSIVGLFIITLFCLIPHFQ